MDNKKNLSGIIFSIILHIIFFLVILSTIHKSNFLVPSRSNGIQVELVTLEQITPVKQDNLLKSTQPIKPIINNAEININEKKEKKIQQLKQNTEIKESNPVENVKMQIKQENKREKKPTKDPTKQVNDLLHGIDTKKGHNKGLATNGNNNGTSKSNNLISDYADLVIERVRPFVNVPNNMDSDSFALVEVTLLPNMQIYELKLIHSSGNSLYDESVQNAIRRGASVFPPLPAGANWADFQTIKLTFRPY